MTKQEETKLMDEMKVDISNKTECMINSYSEVMTKVKREMYNKNISVDDSEILKRVDMFWNIAVQKIEKEYVENNTVRNTHQANHHQSHHRNANKKELTPMGTPMTMTNEEMDKFIADREAMSNKQTVKKSPCQQKAEDRVQEEIDKKNKKIVELKAEITTMAKDNVK